ncbi:UNVERIFIED_CONTAM: hypothetical protein PYX00_005403 [Menopon gallinae]|uniref:HIT-type domain-containing protein n=1 Tax=Menopon gallinae TaxID=328185 RepID=A0AAW2HR80_9NEOP
MSSTIFVAQIILPATTISSSYYICTHFLIVRQTKYYCIHVNKLLIYITWYSNKMNEKQCEVCQTKEGRYVCPKCDILYCSVDCFRAEQHTECSEIFYKKCVEEELQFQRKAPGKDNIAEILLRSHIAADDDDDVIDSDDDSEDGEKVDDLAVRLENVDLDNEDEIWEKLNPEERRAFKNLISSGDIRKILPDWQPWWKFYKSKRLVCEVGLENENADEFILPVVDLKVPAFNELTKKTPAANIPFMIANLLMSYAYTARWFKGKHCDMPVEGVSMLFALSSAVRSNKTFESLVEAYVEFENDVKSCKWLKQNEINFDTICEDVTDFVKGEKVGEKYFSVKACLCDVNNLIKKAVKEVQDDQPIQLSRFTGTAPSQQQMKLLSKKITFYLSWIQEFGEQLKCILP